MAYSIAADAVLLLHLAFIVFVVAGAALLWRWPQLVWVHLPALIWGAWVEAAGTVCPLTPLENRLRALAGEAGYGGGFIDHYVMPLIYPLGLTRELQWLLHAGLVALNVALYALWIAHLRRARR